MHWLTQLVHEPGRLRLVSKCRLQEAIILSAGLPDLRGRLIAESIHRAWLRGGSDAGELEESGLSEAWQKGGLSGELVEALRIWVADQGRERNWEAPPIWSLEAPPACSEELSRLLGIWHQADGFIPVVSSDPNCVEAVALPFRLYDGGEGFSHQCQGSRGAQCGADFQEALNAAARIAVKFEWLQGRQSLALELGNLDGPCGIEVSGQSAGLPILLAIGFRHRGLRVPVFAWGASGVLEPARCGLASHDLGGSYDLKASLMASMGIARAVLPGPGEGRWSPAGSLLKLIDELIDELRCRSDVQDDKRESFSKQIHQWMRDMHFGYADASSVERKLTRLIDAELAEDRPWLQQARAEAMLGLAAAWNHLGKAAEARQSLEKTLALMQDLPVSFQGDAFVRQSVILQDIGDYEAADRSCLEVSKLASRAARVGMKLPLELKIKTYGTRGQVLACAALDSGCEETAQNALKLLQRALELARVRDVGQSDLEAPRNAGYVYWWHALHAPDRANEAWDGAHKAAKADLNTDTMDYLLRNRWLAVYRHGLIAGSAPAWIGEVDENQIPNKGWQRGISLKYRGALRALGGRREKAVEDFSQAIALLTEGRNGGDGPPLFRFFAATTALQAVESLAGIPDGSRLHYLETARKLFDGIPDFVSWFSERRFCGKAWIQRTAELAAYDNVAASPHPQLYYPY